MSFDALPPGVAVVCAIGSTDPWNAAGLGLDVRALAECGVRTVMVVAGVTAQDAQGVAALHAVPAALVEAQFASLAAAHVDAYRIGALIDSFSCAAVARALEGATAPVVYDPVIRASAGGAFAGAATLATIVSALLPRADVVTPNLDEAAMLLDGPVPRSVREMSDAARALRARGPRGVLVKGGHLGGERAPDVYFDGELHVFDDARIEGTLRGTGCLLADAIAAWLARGLRPLDAIGKAHAFVRDKIANGRELGPFRTAY